MYFHTWELDPEQPMLSAGSFLTRVRHYRNLRRMESRIEYFLSRYTFTSIADYLGISPVVVEPGPAPARRTATPFPILMPSSRRTVTRTPVSIVVPCYNEELVLPYLANTLKSVRERLANDYDLTFLLVDDGSTDHTWNGLQQSFGSWADCRLLKHNVNQGVAASILTGIRAAQTEIVASIDCDCTYDPHELANMIPMLVEGVDLVTASPYHPQGHVRNVPAWRLQLSKGASWLYRRVLHQPLHTFTSCFRVYRRSAVCDLQLRERNFLGVTELLGRLLLRGAKVVEYPATLEVRMIGRSKMKTVRTILGHLRLMARLTAARFGQAQHAGPNTAQPIVVESPTDTVERQRA
jgi:GT2 family glycosyltransferase